MKRIFSLTAAATAVAAALSLALSGGASQAATAHHRASLPKISVAMNGKKITVSGALQSGGVRIVSTVTRERQGAPIFVRLDPGVTLAQFFALLHSSAASDPNNLDGTATIVTDAQANRGTSTIQANLHAGHYVAFDSVRNNPAKWPFTTFTIAAAAHPAALPAPAATIAAIEFGFRGPRRICCTRATWSRFANHGFLVHMIVFATAASHRQARNGRPGICTRSKQGLRPAGTPPGSAPSPGRCRTVLYQQLVIRNHRGWYVLACFMDDPGRP